MVDPPVELGDAQATLAYPFPAVTVTFRGVLGASSADAVTKLEGPPSPTLLVAVTDT